MPPVIKPVILSKDCGEEGDQGLVLREDMHANVIVEIGDCVSEEIINFADDQGERVGGRANQAEVLFAVIRQENCIQVGSR